MNPDVLHTPVIPASVPDDGVLAELDAVVKTSRRHSPPRRSALRRALHGAGGVFTRLLERLVPERPRSDPPPEIRFPLF